MDTTNETRVCNPKSAFLDTGAAVCERHEGQLVEASQAGDQEAFALLVQRYQSLVFNLSLRLVNDYDEASEITQEAFLAAWQGLPGFRGEARFSTWLYRITYHCGMRQLEKRKREGALREMMAAELTVRARGQEQLLEDVIEKHEQQALVRMNLEHLPAHYRLVLILRDFQEMTYQEIASRLSLPLGTIKTHLFRARQLLKQRILALTLEQQAL
ncbi:MAG TPA: sigma-70 family RNA polymerase sigma factor [Ktedonobacteraceae bacterium]|nr:sigma-70 family RNA polymerase sigma factor [Ktedonobacteraceae bacterium]